jgi:hypothetical protein
MYYLHRLECWVLASNPNRGIQVWSPVQGVIPTVYRIQELKKWLRSNEIIIIIILWPPLWSIGQRSGFDSRRNQIFWEVVGLERGPLSLVRVQLRSYLEEVAAPVQKAENTAVGNRHADHVAPSIRKSWH